ncbi:MAG: MFS transporter [Phycisphaerae bacterium]|nr:MFS transporter [Phycisphaerae bacterium]
MSSTAFADAQHTDSQPLRRNLQACTGDGVTYSFMVGIGETYLAAFAVALHFSGAVSGLVTTAPLLAGGVVQLIAPHAMRRVASPRRWVMCCATLQAASLIPLAIGAFIGAMPAVLVFLCASLYWAGALAAASVWNTWVGELFPARLRARYFGKRNRLCQLATLAGLLIGGGLIGFSERADAATIWLPGSPLVGFAACFGLASASRMLSLAYLRAQGEPPRHRIEHRRVPLMQVIGGRTEYGRLIISMVIFQAAVQVAQPFFNPFMLKAISFDAWTYTGAIAAAFIAKSLALPLAGRIADRRGARFVLVGSAIGIALLGTFWLVSASPLWIIPMQFVAGAVWGGYELAVFLLLLETIPGAERTSVMSWYYLLNSFAMTTGSLLGAMLLSGEETWVAYATVFGVSTLLRLLAVIRFLSIRVDVHQHRPLTVGTLAVRASAGTIDVPQHAEGGGAFESPARRDAT